MPRLKPVDPDFFDSAPARYSRSWSIDRPALEVWGEVVGDRPLHWCRGLQANWSSAQPFSVGTTRKAKVLGGLLAVDELFFIWEEGRRCSFYVTAANAPLFISLAEDYTVEPAGPDRCTFTWTIAFLPTVLGKMASPLNVRLFNSFFRDTGRYFKAS